MAGADGLPVEAEPMHRLDDRVDVLLLLFLGIGVVETQVAHAAVLGAPGRSSGRCSSHDRCAGSRWARAGNACGCAPGRAAGAVVCGIARAAAEAARAKAPVSRSRSMTWRKKLLGLAGVGAAGGAGIDTVRRSNEPRRGQGIDVDSIDAVVASIRRARARSHALERQHGIAAAERERTADGRPQVRRARGGLKHQVQRA